MHFGDCLQNSPPNDALKAVVRRRTKVACTRILAGPKPVIVPKFVMGLTQGFQAFLVAAEVARPGTMRAVRRENQRAHLCDVVPEPLRLPPGPAFG
jgi:hypothetical protein